MVATVRFGSPPGPPESPTPGKKKGSKRGRVGGQRVFSPPTGTFLANFRAARAQNTAQAKFRALHILDQIFLNPGLSQDLEPRGYIQGIYYPLAGYGYGYGYCYKLGLPALARVNAE